VNCTVSNADQHSKLQNADLNVSSFSVVSPSVEFEKFMVNHVICVCSIALHQNNISRALNDSPQLVIVTYPWNADEVNMYSGVPPYVSMLQELTVLQTEQWALFDNFLNRGKQPWRIMVWTLSM